MQTLLNWTQLRNLLDKEIPEKYKDLPVATINVTSPTIEAKVIVTSTQDRKAIRILVS